MCSKTPSLKNTLPSNTQQLFSQLSFAPPAALASALSTTFLTSIFSVNIIPSPPTTPDATRSFPPSQPVSPPTRKFDPAELDENTL